LSRSVRRLSPPRKRPIPRPRSAKRRSPWQPKAPRRLIAERLLSERPIDDLLGLRKELRLANNSTESNRHRYPVNELEVTDKAGNKFRLDSHHPQKGEIVSRKFTPLSEVKLETGIGYLREMLRKYPRGARISESRFNPKTLREQLLTGNLILEVPVQKSTVPKAVLDYANKYGIVIRDVNGVRYR
jgi:hypothetical protein